jgi:hypothetical protein
MQQKEGTNDTFVESNLHLLLAIFLAQEQEYAGESNLQQEARSGTDMLLVSFFLDATKRRYK